MGEEFGEEGESQTCPPCVRTWISICPLKAALEAELDVLSEPATNATCKEANIRSGFLQALLFSTPEIYVGREGGEGDKFDE